MAERKQIIWSEFADKQFKKALIHYKNNDNISFSENLINEVNHTINLILENNFIGKSIPKANFDLFWCFLF